MGCALEGNMYESMREDGLQALHAYIVTKMAVVMCRNGEKKLIRIKNPHGNNLKISAVQFTFYNFENHN